jgi:hypothetical protein
MFFIFSHPPTYRKTPMTTAIDAGIYARGEVSFAKFLFLPSGLPNCWRPIFLILPKLDGCQVGFPNSWSCSEIQYNTDTNGTLLLYNKLIGPYIDSTHGTCPFFI